MAVDAIDVSCSRTDDGWACTVRVGSDAAATTHRVSVRAETLKELGHGADPADLVHRSFALLLEREPRTSILSSFDLAVIARYFPEYPDEIARRMRDGRD
jgi:hypothetical protein